MICYLHQLAVAESKAVDEPVIKSEEPAAPIAETGAAAVVADEATKPEDKKKERRASKFLGRFKGLGSPTSEKKQEDVVPASESAVSETAPVIPAETETLPEPVKAVEEAAPVEALPATTTESTEEAAPLAPTDVKERRRSSFFNFTDKFNKKKEGPATPAKDDVVKTEEPVAATETSKDVEEPTAPVTEPVTEPATEAVEPTEEKTPEPKKEKSGGLIALVRNKSKAFRGSAKKEKVKAPETTEEAKTEEKTADDIAPTTAEPEVTKETPAAAIGDVVPEAIHTGTPAVAASA
jgi:hypothetical protein